jgi:DNA polymerase eta
MALSFTGLERLEEGQQGIEGFFPAGVSKPTAHPDTVVKGSINESAEGAKRSRPLSPKLESKAEPSSKKTRLPTLHTGKRKTGLESFLIKNGESSSAAKERLPPPKTIEIEGDDADEVGDHTRPTLKTEQSSKDGVDQAAADSESGGIGRRWMCSQCNTIFAEPDAFGRTLAEQKQEHEDYHFALSLQDDGSNDSRPFGSTRYKEMPMLKGRPKVKSKGRKPEGIKAFFAPKSDETEPA